MTPPTSIQDLTDALNKAHGQLEAIDLELQRAHRMLDDWGLPREAPDPNTGHPTELSLAGRLELIPEEDEDGD
jgi:hypothetical protein